MVIGPILELRTPVGHSLETLGHRWGAGAGAVRREEPGHAEDTTGAELEGASRDHGVTRFTSPLPLAAHFPDSPSWATRRQVGL